MRFIRRFSRSPVESFPWQAVRARLGYQKTRMMKSKCPLCPIVWINVLWSREQRRECFNVAEVDILTDLLILDSVRITSSESGRADVAPLDGTKRLQRKI